MLALHPSHLNNVPYNTDFRQTSDIQWTHVQLGVVQQPYKHGKHFRFIRQVKKQKSGKEVHALHVSHIRVLQGILTHEYR